MVNVEITGDSGLYLALVNAGIRNIQIRATMGGYQVSIYSANDMAKVTLVCQQLGLIS